jgi:hypothetical protein
MALVDLTLAAAPAAAGHHALDVDHPAARALAFFERAQMDGGEALVHRLRPAPPSAELKAAVVASLPPEGELQPSEAERTKIATLEAVFEIYDRKNAIVIKVIDVGHAFVGLHARTVLLLSRDALSLVTADELQALAAHELAHELFWDEYQAARAEGAAARIQELELRCDGVALSALRGRDRGADSLTGAVTKMTRFNERIGATATAGAYVSLKERTRFIKDVTALLEGKGHLALSGYAPEEAPSR